MYRPYCPDCHKETETSYALGWGIIYICKECGAKFDKHYTGKLVRYKPMKEAQ